VFHETTNGPFVRADMKCAAWAPGEDDIEGQKVYFHNLEEKLCVFKPFALQGK